MKKLVFYKTILFASLCIIIGAGCNEEDTPDLPEQNNIINAKDRNLVIDACTQGNADMAFIDSAKSLVTSERTKKAIYDVGDFYSDLYGHLKSIALDKKIIPGQNISVYKTTAASQPQNNIDQQLIDKTIDRLNNRLRAFAAYADQSTDTETKSYFVTAQPLLQKHLTSLLNLSKDQ